MILIIVSITACKQEVGPAGSSGSGGSPAVAANCSSTLQRGWINQTTHIAYEFNSNCTGKIPACNATLEYEIVEIDPSGGTINLVVTHSDNNVICPVTGDQANCTFDYNIVGGQRMGMYVRCNNGPVVYYTNSYGTD